MRVGSLEKGLFTFIPGSNYILPRIEKVAPNSALYCYGVWIKHLTMLREYGETTIPNAIAEIGPGDSLGTGLAALLSEHYHGHDGSSIRILEAGCGPRWLLDLTGVEYTLTGVDIYERDLEIRKNKTKDLDEGIVGDLRTVELDADAFDVTYNSFVLEHARLVLDKFPTMGKAGRQDHS